MAASPAAYRSEARLRDGAPVVIRALAPTDRSLVFAVFRRMSQASVRHRYFAAKRDLVESDLAFLGELAEGRSVALVAVVGEGAGERALGIGRYAVLDTPGTAEVAFEVGDADQGRGVGTLLLEHLAAIARDRGLVTFVAEVEADNRQMLEVFEHSGFAIRETLDHRVYHVEFPIADTAQFLAATAARRRRAPVAAGA